MNTYAKLAAAAAAVLVLAVVGYQLIPKNGGIGGPAASPSPSLLAKGTFTVVGYATTIDAIGAGTNVSGTLHASNSEGAFTVALKCGRTVDGLHWIAGDVTESTSLTNAPVGSRTGIVLKPGSPAKAIFIFQMSDPAYPSCLAFFDAMLASGDDIAGGVQPIAGTVQLAP